MNNYRVSVAVVLLAALLLAVVRTDASTKENKSAAKTSNEDKSAAKTSNEDKSGDKSSNESTDSDGKTLEECIVDVCRGFTLPEIPSTCNILSILIGFPKTEKDKIIAIFGNQGEKVCKSVKDICDKFNKPVHEVVEHFHDVLKGIASGNPIVKNNPKTPLDVKGPNGKSLRDLIKDACRGFSLPQIPSIRTILSILTSFPKTGLGKITAIYGSQGGKVYKQVKDICDKFNLPIEYVAYLFIEILKNSSSGKPNIPKIGKCLLPPGACESVKF